MEMPKVEKAKRQGRASQHQISLMVDYMVQHPHVATNKFLGMRGRQELQGSWEELAAFLNTHSVNGKTKNVESWKTTWRDTKTDVSKRVSALRKMRAATGNKPVDLDANLSDRDKKILGIIGFNYIEGMAETPDSFPEEMPNVMSHLASGETAMYAAAPQALTIRAPAVDVLQGSRVDIVDCMPLEGVSIEISGDAAEVQVIAAEPVVQHSEVDLDQPRTQSPLLPSEQPPEQPPQEPYQQLCQQPSTSQARTPPNRRTVVESVPDRRASLGRRGIQRERLGIQLLDAREEFTSLQEKQVSCMEMLAKAAVMTAENDRERNNILRTMAENDRARNETMVRLIDVLQRVADALPKPTHTNGSE